MQPGCASGLRPALNQIQMDDVNGLNAEQLVLRISGNIDVARMIRPKPIRLRTHPFIDLDTQPHRIAAPFRCQGAFVIDQKVGLNDLETERHIGAAKAFVNFPDKNFTVLEDRADD